MEGMKYLFFIVLLVGIISAGCVSGNQKNAVAPAQTTTLPTSTPVPISTPVPTTIQTQAIPDPIIGSWINGMVFYANGAVGTDGTTSWKVNENEKNSYFVVFNGQNPNSYYQPLTANSTEWIYNPALDRINKQGSSEFVLRGTPTPTPTQSPTIKPTSFITTYPPPVHTYDPCTDQYDPTCGPDQVRYYGTCMYGVKIVCR